MAFLEPVTDIEYVLAVLGRIHFGLFKVCFGVVYLREDELPPVIGDDQPGNDSHDGRADNAGHDLLNVSAKDEHADVHPGQDHRKGGQAYTVEKGSPSFSREIVLRLSVFVHMDHP